MASNIHQDRQSTERRRWLIAAFDDEARARRAADDAQAHGTAAHSIRIGNSLDALASIEAEMHEETRHVGAGVTGPVTWEGVRGLALGAVLGAIVGVVIALPFALIEFGDLSLTARLLILGIVGLVFGGFVGLFLGGAFGLKRPSEPLAATKGTILALPDTEGARRALLHAAPTRVDVFGAGGHLLSTLLTNDPGAVGTVEQLAQHARDESSPD